MGGQHHQHGGIARLTGRAQFADDPQAACMRLAAQAARAALTQGRGRRAADAAWGEVADWWYADTGSRDEDRARAICRTCPLRESCLDHAIRVAEPEGIWGGLNRAERGALKQRRKVPA